MRTTIAEHVLVTARREKHAASHVGRPKPPSRVALAIEIIDAVEGHLGDPMDDRDVLFCEGMLHAARGVIRRYRLAGGRDDG